MYTLLVGIVVLSALSLLANLAFIAHELGLFPHTKDRSSPAIRAFPFDSRYDRNRATTHGFQVFSPFSELARKFGHAEIYRIEDPYQLLETVIDRYQAEPIRSRYDDLIHVSNYVCNHGQCDDRVNALISRIHELIHKLPVRGL